MWEFSLHFPSHPNKLRKKVRVNRLLTKTPPPGRYQGILLKALDNVDEKKAASLNRENV